MRELRRTNDLAWLSMAEALLRGEGLSPVVLDGAISAAEGGIGAFPRRLMITEDEEAQARRLLKELDAAYGPG
jgi:Putative prokaryotic signal transducing protein